MIMLKSRTVCLYGLGPDHHHVDGLAAVVLPPTRFVHAGEEQILPDFPALFFVGRGGSFMLPSFL